MLHQLLLGLSDSLFGSVTRHAEGSDARGLFWPAKAYAVDTTQLGESRPVSMAAAYKVDVRGRRLRFLRLSEREALWAVEPGVPGISSVLRSTAR